MIGQRRTDLASEAREIWQETADETTKLQGVTVQEKTVHGFEQTTVKILDAKGAEALDKPQGTYITLELGALLRREKDSFSRGVLALREALGGILQIKPSDSVLLVGLGNPAITPDAIGPLVAKQTLATRHLRKLSPEHFANFRAVSVLQTGVLGTTGVESAELVKAFAKEFAPDRVIVVDALASRKFSRVCRTVQLADTGIVPGSGIANARAALNRETLGVPVVALGVPTVVDAGTLAADILEETGGDSNLAEKFLSLGKDMFVTPKEIDSQVADIAKVMAYAVNAALHEELSLEDIDMLAG